MLKTLNMDSKLNACIITTLILIKNVVDNILNNRLKACNTYKINNRFKGKIDMRAGLHEQFTGGRVWILS